MQAMLFRVLHSDLAAQSTAQLMPSNGHRRVQHELLQSTCCTRHYTLRLQHAPCCASWQCAHLQGSHGHLLALRCHC